MHDHTLHGDYGFALEGEILGPGLQFRGIVMQKYDGKGNLLRWITSSSTARRQRRSGRLAVGPTQSIRIAPDQQ